MQKSATSIVTASFYITGTKPVRVEITLCGGGTSSFSPLRLILRSKERLKRIKGSLRKRQNHQKTKLCSFFLSSSSDPSFIQHSFEDSNFASFLCDHFFQDVIQQHLGRNRVDSWLVTQVSHPVLFKLKLSFIIDGKAL